MDYMKRKFHKRVIYMNEYCIYTYIFFTLVRYTTKDIKRLYVYIQNLGRSQEKKVPKKNHHRI